MAVTRPSTFMHFMSLRTGTFLILLVQLINKVTAFFGILALATSYPLNFMQFSMYIYSLFILGLTIYCLPYIRKGSAFHCLLFAQSYLVDSVVNALYTAGFTASWFLVLAGHENAGKVPGGETIGHTGGFTSPVHNVSQVDIVASPAGGAKAAQDAVAVGSGAGGNAAGEGLSGAMFNSGSVMSMFIICFFWALRGYAVFVVISYARQVLRQHIYTTNSANYDLHSGNTSSDLAENPFAEQKPAGKGWKGKVGRTMVSIGRRYWLGRNEADETWIKMMGGKFTRQSEDQGPTERERRRRSGTGPPAAPSEMIQRSA